MGEYDDDYRPSHDERLQRAEAEAAGLRKRLAERGRDLELLERVRAHPRLCSVLDLLKSEADDSRPFIKLGAPRAESRVALLDDVVGLLSPGDAGRGEDGQ